MLILGITGGVGSGKSKILYDLSNLYGAYIVETDKLAHTLMEPGQTVYQAVVEAFGTEILQAEEPYAIDRAKFAQIVFADKRKACTVKCTYASGCEGMDSERHRGETEAGREDLCDRGGTSDSGWI